MTENTLAQRVPVIDISGLRTGSDAERRRVAREIGDAARSIGFLSITGHGIPTDLLRETFVQARAFFDLPQSEKDKVASNGGYRGYIAPGSLSNGDLQESFDLGVEYGPGEIDPYSNRPLVSANRWPESLPGFRDTLLGVFRDSFTVFAEMHRAIAIDLGADPEYFTPLFGKNYGFRISQYSVVEDPFKALGASPHTDFGSLTLLAHDSPGLEVQADDGTWIRVDASPETLVCNIADCMLRWSNDAYRSTRHRVVNPTTKPRISVGFFANANLDAMVEPLPSCVGPDRPAHYAPIEFGDYMQAKFSGPYLPQNEAAN